MPSAKYRDALTIQKLATPVDPATGEQAVESESNWLEYFTCFGEVIVKGTREFIRAGIVDADVSHIIRVPRSNETDGINANMRIILIDTEETLHIMDTYRKDSASRQIEMVCRS
jgi:head-tail adaptor